MEFTNEELEAYYRRLPEDGGFESMCKTTMPGADELAGKRALDVGCRRGKGVYKLSSLVGSAGQAHGVDWRSDMIEAARAGVPNALRRNNLVDSNMAFTVAYPENLIGAGVEKASFDVVYVNSVLNLFLSPIGALVQMRRVLKPGGLAVIETVLATGKRDDLVVFRARKQGNPIQSAPDHDEFMRWLAAAGLDVATIEEQAEEPVDPSAAVDDAHTAPVATSDESVSFVPTIVRIRR